MRIALRLLKWLLVALIALAAIAFALPRSHHVERDRIVEVPPERIWPLLADPREWKRWSPWNQKDPDMQITYSGPASGAGAGWSWKSSSQGSGTVRFTQADPPKRLGYTIAFTNMGSSATGEFRLEPVPEGTRIVWAFDSDAGNNPMMRWFGLLLDRMVGADFEAGLARLAIVAGD